MNSQRYISNKINFVQNNIERVKNSVRRLQYSIDKNIKYQPQKFNIMESHTTTTSNNHSSNLAKSLNLYNTKNLGAEYINFHKNCDSSAKNGKELNIPLNKNNFAQKTMTSIFSINKYKTKTLEVPKNQHKYNSSHLNNNELNVKIFDESNSSISQNNYKCLKNSVPTNFPNNSSIAKKFPLNNIKGKKNSNFNMYKGAYMTPNHFFHQKNLSHNKNSFYKNIYINNANFNKTTDLNVLKNYSSYLNDKVDESNDNNRELINEYENVANQYKLAFEKNIILKNRIEKLAIKSKNLKNINEELTNNYNEIVNNLMQDSKMSSIEKSDNIIINLKDNSQKLKNKLIKYDELISQLKTNINLLSTSRNDKINDKNNIDFVNNNSNNKKKIEELIKQINLKKLELEKHKKNFEIAKKNNIKLMTEINQLIKKKNLKNNSVEKIKYNKEIMKLTKENNIYLNNIKALQNEIENINNNKINDNELVTQQNKIEKKKEFLELKKQNEKCEQEIQKYNAIVNNLVNTNQNMSNIYSNQILELKEIYNEIIKNDVDKKNKNNTNNYENDNMEEIEIESVENYDENIEQEKLNNEIESNDYEKDMVSIGEVGEDENNDI